MSFAVSRMIKMKANDLKGMQYHNQRERESKTNADIEKSKTNLNYDLVNSEKISFTSKVNEIIEEQKTGSRKIRKDAVVVCEWVITSDSAYFEGLSPKEEQRFFEESYKFFSERYGKQNVPYAIVHKDEKTPHMHLGVVPMRDGKLQAKNIFNRTELLKIQNEFPKHLQDKGFDLERGKQGSTAKHIKTQQFKADTLDKKVQELEKNLNEVAAATYRQQETSEQVDEIEVKERKDLKAKIGFRGAQKLEIASEDFEKVKTLAKASEALKRENKRILSENEKLRAENKKMRDSITNLQLGHLGKQNQNRKLQEEIIELKEKVQSLERVKEILLKTLESLKKNAPRFLEVGLEKMQDYVGEIRLHILTSEFGKEVLKGQNHKSFVPKDELRGASIYIQKVERIENEKKQKEKKPGQDQELRENEKNSLESKKPKAIKQKDDFEMER